MGLFWRPKAMGGVRRRRSGDLEKIGEDVGIAGDDVDAEAEARGEDRDPGGTESSAKENGSPATAARLGDVEEIGEPPGEERQIATTPARLGAARRRRSRRSGPRSTLRWSYAIYGENGFCGWREEGGERKRGHVQ
ncbi:hypothetical protein TIFTF001_037467 [Ficus carica]|uniref:Uncharacterized protein n=1 Tax=Ficus carica TaxID=3494 RepID=A0AA88EH46_FICCA|nr:hypothetical protein TIFTF001_037467 [Ficus carica]